MIKPTVGRVVWFHPNNVSPTNDGIQPLAALVAYVWGDTLVNIAGFDSNGLPFARTSVILVQDDSPVPLTGGAPWCEWMPYQKGQAAKTEALEAAMASGIRPLSGGGPPDR